MNKLKSKKQPLRVAVIGLGGYAASHHRALHTLEAEGLCRVIAACDPELERFAETMRQEKFVERNIRSYSCYLEMLDSHRHELDFVTVPTPIPLHASMHRACVERRLACYLEKPPTLSWKELDEMLDVEKRAIWQTQTGFAHIAEGPRQKLKQRLIAGEFGRTLRVGFAGQWPRAAAYFRRTAWAGRVQVNGELVLDSCTGNAMSHYIHNVLFWCGSGGVMSWGQAELVEAELYRAHDIENFDTCFARGVCSNGIRIAIAATHTGEGASHHIEWCECENATITYQTGATIHTNIAWRGGGEENADWEVRDSLTNNFLSYMSYLHGETTRPPTRLADSLPFVHFNSMLYVAAKGIRTIPGEYIIRPRNEINDSNWVVVDGMKAALETFRRSNHLPSENGTAWGFAGGCAPVTQLASIGEVLRRFNALEYGALNRGSGH